MAVDEPIPVAEPWITDREIELVTDAIHSGWVSPNGDYVDAFESAFAEALGSTYAFATSTGTAALHLTLVAADVGTGDEVLVPDLTWISCANVVRYVGADPVFVDVDPETMTMDPIHARRAVTDATAAVLPVHLYGHPCEMTPLLDIATEHDLFVLEDAAEAHGARYRDAPVGTLGDAGCFSFYGNKTLTTGQGGMITTDDPDLAERIQLYRRDGMSTERKYYHPVVGYNYRLTNLQAAMGVAQVERIDELTAAKRRVASRYRENLEDHVRRIAPEREWALSGHWMTVAVFEDGGHHDAVQTTLAADDVATRPVFVPLHDQPPYENVRVVGGEVASELYETGLVLPSSPTLTDEQIDGVCDRIRECL